VERKNATLQDRLVKEQRLRGVSTIAAANALLAGDPPAARSSSSSPSPPSLSSPSFLAALNGRFGVEPARKADLHRRVTAAMKLDDEVLCVREERAVGRDWCVQWRGRLLEVGARHEPLDLPRPGRRVLVVEKADGAVLLRYGGVDLSLREVARRPEKPKPPKKPVVNNKRHVPPADHPWNRRRAGGRAGGRAPRTRPAARPSAATPPRPLRRDTRQGTVLLR
jgi:hypothetical protein